jgi:hypothetical protein
MLMQSEEEAMEPGAWRGTRAGGGSGAARHEGRRGLVANRADERRRQVVVDDQ